MFSVSLPPFRASGHQREWVYRQMRNNLHRLWAWYCESNWGADCIRFCRI